MYPTPRTLSKLKREIYLNAERLFQDACHLFMQGSYPSACALAVLAYEELGKLEMVDHICDDIILNPHVDRRDFLSHLFSRSMYFSHRTKQEWASVFDGTPRRQTEVSQGRLEKLKQDALYVSYAKRRIVIPKRLTKNVAYRELRHAHAKFKRIGDLGFNGFYCDSTPHTKREAREHLKHLTTLIMLVRSRS